MPARETRHESIARYLRNDRCARDAEALVIAIDYSVMLDAEFAYRTAVDEHVIGRDFQSRERALHRERTRVIDVDAIDLAR